MTMRNSWPSRKVLATRPCKNGMTRQSLPEMKKSWLSTASTWRIRLIISRSANTFSSANGRPSRPMPTTTTSRLLGTCPSMYQPIVWKFGPSRSCSSSIVSASRPLWQACPQISFLQMVSSGETPSMTGTSMKRQVLAGGFTGSMKALRFTTCSGLTILKVFQIIGRWMVRQRSQKTVLGSQDLVIVSSRLSRKP